MKVNIISTEQELLDRVNHPWWAPAGLSRGVQVGSVTLEYDGKVWRRKGLSPDEEKIQHNERNRYARKANW